MPLAMRRCSALEHCVPACTKFADAEITQPRDSGIDRTRRPDFTVEGVPPTDQPMEVLCEDKSGTYALPYVCRWTEGLVQLCGRRGYRSPGSWLALMELSRSITEFKFFSSQPPPKQLVSQPNPIGVEHVGLAVVGNLTDTSGLVVRLDLGAVDPVGLPRQSHGP